MSFAVFREAPIHVVDAVLMGRPSMIIDCSEIAKAKNDAGLTDALAEQTGQCYPLCDAEAGLYADIYQATTPSSPSCHRSMA